MPQEDDEPSGPPWRPLIGLVVLIIVCIGVWFVMQQLRQSAATQDCLASGRTNCAPISTH